MSKRDEWSGLKKLLVVVGLALASWAVVAIIIYILRGAYG